MGNLIKPDGRIDFGVYERPVDTVNFMDYRLETPMGRTVGGPLKRLRFKQFNYVGIIGPELMAGLAVVDLKLLSNGFFYVFDRRSGDLVEAKKLALSRRAFIGCSPSRMDSRFKASGLEVRIEGNRVTAKSKELSLDATMDLSSSRPLRICTRAGYRGWGYTEKTTPVPISGELRCGDKNWDLSSPESFALVDWSGGFMRRTTCWNWAAVAARLPDGRTLGLNLAAGVNETGFTENAFWLGGAMTKVDTVNFVFDPADLSSAWKIRSADGKVDLEFTPENKREEKTNALILASRFTQLMGRYNGALTTDAGEAIEIRNLPGFAEDHWAKW